MKNLIAAFRAFGKSEEGASLVEYGLLVALIAAICVVIIKAIGVKVNTAFANVNNQMP